MLESAEKGSTVILQQGFQHMRGVLTQENTSVASRRLDKLANVLVFLGQIFVIAVVVVRIVLFIIVVLRHSDRHQSGAQSPPAFIVEPLRFRLDSALSTVTGEIKCPRQPEALLSRSRGTGDPGIRCLQYDLGLECEVTPA